MIRYLFASVLFLSLSSTTFAQAPEKMSYQAVVRDASNNLVVNTTIGMQSSILQGSATGTEVYVETQNPMTNENGLISVELGAGAVLTGVFADIDWENGPYFIKTEFDITGGTNYTIEATSQLLSVPYALHAKTVEEKQTLELNGNDLTISDANTITLPNSVGGNQNKVWVILTGDINDADAAIKLANEVGESTRYIVISNTTQLSNVDMTGFAENELIELKINDNSSLTSVIIPEVKRTFEQLYIAHNPNLLTLQMNGIEKASGRAIDESGVIIEENPLLEDIQFQSLIEVSNGLFKLHNADAIANFQLNALEMSSLDIRDCSFQDAINFNSLLTIPICSLLNNTAPSIELNSLSSISTRFYIKDNEIGNSFTLPSLVIAEEISCIANDFSDVFMNSLTTCQDIRIWSNEFVSNIELNALSTVDDLSIFGDSQFTTLNFPSLEIGQTLSFDGPSLNSIYCPELTEVVNFICDKVTSLTEVELPSLTLVTEMYIYLCNLQNFDLPSLENISFANTGISGNGPFIHVTANSLDSNSINLLLSRFVDVLNSGNLPTNPVVPIWINLQQNPPSPPTGQGLIDLQTLNNASNIFVVETN